MTDRPPHPLETMRSVDQLLELPYFELLSCLTDGSLHPGGGAATQLLLDACQVRPDAKVLEVGCGPGWTTRALLGAGIDVSVVERSPLMLDAMRHHCASQGIAPPPARLSAADALGSDRPFGHRFDLVILECVVGFVDDRAALARFVDANLASDGKVGILDVHYVAQPPPSVLDEVAAVTGHRIDPMTERDWLQLLPTRPCIDFKSFQLPSTSADSAEQLVEEADLSRWFPDAQADTERLVARIRRAGLAFDANRAYLRGHIAVYGGS